MPDNTFGHWLLRFTSVAGIIFGVVTLVAALPDNQSNPHHPAVLGISIVYLVGFVAYLLVDVFQWYIFKQKRFFEGWTQEEINKWKHMSNADKARYEEEIAALMAIINDETPVKRSHISPQTRQAVLQRDNHTCVWCGGVGSGETDHNGETFQVDHIIPVSRGGKTIISNLATTCRFCNNTKGGKTPIEYLRYRNRHNRNPTPQQP